MEEENKEVPYFIENCIAFRNELKPIAEAVKTFKGHTVEQDTVENEDRGEELANITLAYRHLEDASMRLGKAMQAYQGGVSVYDKKIENESSAVGS